MTESRHALLYGDLQGSAEALPTLLNMTNSKEGLLSLEGMDKEAAAVLASAKVFAETGTVQLGESLRLARQNVLGANTEVKQERAIAFNGVENFKMANLTPVILDIFAEEGLIWDTEADGLAPGVKNRMHTLLKAAYLETGSEEAAKQLVKTQYGRMYGISNMSNDSKVMLLPPENLYPDIDPEVLKIDLQESVIPFLPENVELDNVYVESSGLTTANPDAPAYTVFYVGEDGIPRELLDDSGEGMIWTPDKQNIENLRNRENMIDVAVSMAEVSAIRESGVRLPNTLGGSLVGSQVFAKAYNFAVKTYAGLTTESKLRSETNITELQKAEVKLAEARSTGDVEQITEATKEAMQQRALIGEDTNIVQRDKLGSVTKWRESSNRPDAYNPSDPNGGSYGLWQLNANTLKHFLKNSEYGIEFTGLKPGTSGFLAK